MNKPLKLFFVLQLSVVMTIIGSLYDLSTISLTFSLLLIIGGFLVFGRFSISPIFSLIFITATILYLIEPGLLKPGVSLIPFIGFFLLPISPEIQLKEGAKIAKILSLVSIFSIHTIGLIGYKYFDLNFINYQSQLYLYVILINVLIFKEPFVLSVLLAFILPAFFSPGLIGNRSAFFLLFFLLNRNYINSLINALNDKKRFLLNFAGFIAVVLLIYKLISWLINHPKFEGDYEEPRFIWFALILESIQKNGLPEFIKNGINIIDGTVNPHNSFIWLLFNEAYVGLLKILLFLISIFILPFSSWSAIFGRVNLDSFFFVGPLGILYCSMLRVFYRNEFRLRFKQVIKLFKGGLKISRF
jgi:hypothetical protein